MFSFFFTKSAQNQAIVESRLFTEQGFYDAFIRDVKKAQKSVTIESPFLTEKRTLQLIRTFEKLHKRRVKVIVYTRTPKHRPYRLQGEAMRAIQTLHMVGVTIYECYDYRHRKVAIIDRAILWEGSLNILSQSKSRETMRRIVSAPLSNQMLNLIKH